MAYMEKTLRRGGSAHCGHLDNRVPFGRRARLNHATSATYKGETLPFMIVGCQEYPQSSFPIHRPEIEPISTRREALIAPLVLSGLCSVLSLSPARAEEVAAVVLDEIVAPPAVTAPAVNYASKVLSYFQNS